ncbi:MAG: D-Ala-D-Ala carboxypeptidase family metallohydrolase [Neisseria sp.]|nr:D-Ala-D-Ala carboxypeptidase family metallohydrolase [Neisseria sp.]
MQITDHFSLRELTRSETARRRGVANIPTAAEMENIRYTAERLEAVRAYVGRPIIVTSCYRSEQVNRLVGGSKTSAHRYGLAADCDAAGLTSAEFAAVLIKMRNEGRLDFDQLILEFPERGDGAWVHIGFTRSRKPRGQILTATKRGGKTVYLPGLQL